jgi:hypothetical protein
VETSLPIVLALVGSAAGVAYSVLGVLALKHLGGATEVDRTIGWSLLWSLEWRRYDAEGRRLCRVGGIVFLLSAACWAVLFWVWRR